MHFIQFMVYCITVDSNCTEVIFVSVDGCHMLTIKVRLSVCQLVATSVVETKAVESVHKTSDSSSSVFKSTILIP
jgi:hypothetical protein